MKIILHSFQGLIMGIAELIPGVSGSNFALVMGIYDDFVNFLDSLANFGTSIFNTFIKRDLSIIKNSFKEVRWMFGIPLLVGMFLASASFSNIITELLENHAKYIFSLFFGLVAASIAVPWNEIKTKNSKIYIITFVSFLFFFIFFGFRPASFGTEPPIILLFVAGVVGVVGNVLPGISGPFLLLMIGLYDFIIALLAKVTTLRFDIDLIQKFLIFFAGQIVGLVLFVKLLKYILDKFPGELMAFMTGLMIASLRVTYPFFEGPSENRKYVLPWEFNLEEIIVMILLIIFGFVLVIAIGKLGVDREQVRKIQG